MLQCCPDAWDRIFEQLGAWEGKTRSRLFYEASQIQIAADGVSRQQRAQNPGSLDIEYW